MSCRGCNWKFHAFTYKELETGSVAQKVLGAPTIDVGSARAEGGDEGRQRSQIRPHAIRNVQKQRKNRWFCALFGL
jgi:hypothetical protein